MWQGFDIVGGLVGADFMRKHERLSPHQTKPAPAGSRIDPMLGKAAPVSHVGSTSVITCF